MLLFPRDAAFVVSVLAPVSKCQYELFLITSGLRSVGLFEDWRWHWTKILLYLHLLSKSSLGLLRPSYYLSQTVFSSSWTFLSSSVRDLITCHRRFSRVRYAWCLVVGWVQSSICF
jgi:hypothetical protein